MMIYMLLGLCGYYSFGLETPEIIIFRDPLPNPYTFEKEIARFADKAMTIGLICFGLSLLISLPLNSYPASENILSLIYPDGQRNRFVEPVVKLVFAYVPALIAVFFQDIIAAFSIIGGFCGAWIAILIPGMGYVKLLKPEKKIKKTAFLAFTIFFTLCGWTSAFLSFLSLL